MNRREVIRRPIKIHESYDSELEYTEDYLGGAYLTLSYYDVDVEDYDGRLHPITEYSNSSREYKEVSDIGINAMKAFIRILDSKVGQLGIYRVDYDEPSVSKNHKNEGIDVQCFISVRIRYDDLEDIIDQICSNFKYTDKFEIDHDITLSNGSLGHVQAYKCNAFIED